MTPRSWLLMGTLAALWGASYMFIEVSLEDLGPAFLVFTRIALGAAVLVPIALHRRVLPALRGRMGAVAVMAAMQVVGPFLLIAWGQERIASSLAGILVASAPIFTALLAVYIDDEERMRGWSGVGIVVGIAGVALLFGVDLTGDERAVLGGMAVLLAGLGYALGGFWLKRRLRGVPPVAVAASTMATGALALAPVAVATLPAAAPGIDTVGAMLMLGAGGTGVAFLIFYTLIADLGPSRAAVVAYIAPAFAVFYGVVLLGEPFTVGIPLGMVLILLGSWLAAEGRLPGRPRVTRSEPSHSNVPAPVRAP